MKNKILFIISGSLNILWGIAHLFPTKNIVRDFGNIPIDKKRIILMEWINEGLTLIFLGVLIIAVTFINSNNQKVKKTVYLLTFCMLIAMAVLSLFTGFKIDFIPFQLCPFIFSTSAILILIGILKK